MKLIGSYTSPFVRKISVILLEKRIPFEFVNESPYSESNGVARYNQQDQGTGAGDGRR